MRGAGFSGRIEEKRVDQLRLITGGSAVGGKAFNKEKELTTSIKDRNNKKRLEIQTVFINWSTWTKTPKFRGTNFRPKKGETLHRVRA